jgi:hypothetical protein
MGGAGIILIFINLFIYFDGGGAFSLELNGISIKKKMAKALSMPPTSIKP